MTQPYVTGPAHVFVEVTGGVAYLGTTERTPKILIRPAWEPLFNDIGGKVPFDMSYEGEEAFISGDFNRFNESVYADMAARASALSAPVRGIDTPGNIGALMLTEKLTINLWMLFPYTAKPAMNPAGNAMPSGYHFYATYLVGPDELEPLGTTPRKIRLIWHALRIFDAQGNFNLYDHDMSVVAGLSVQ